MLPLELKWIKLFQLTVKPKWRSFLLSCIFLSSNSLRQGHSFVKMAELTPLTPPLAVRGLKSLDRGIFNVTVSVPCLNIKGDLVHPVIKEFKQFFFKMPKFKSVRQVGDSECREVLLNPKMVSDYKDIETQLSSLGLDKSYLGSCELNLTYDNWSADDVLKAILPENVDIAAGYSLVGHIVHLNLRDHLIEYKHVIGEVLLDKIKQARTVVNKVDTIDSSFRVFKMEVLAGEPEFITEVKENSSNYKFDFSKVYWNPRLSTEHERIVKKLDPGDILFDVFAGVGPFAIPAARKKCIVLANDLNPESFKWLQYNSKLNKVDNLVKTFNKDGADFIKEDVKSYILQHKPKSKSHIVMNLPAIAVKFLSGFKNIFSDDQMESIGQLPKVHVYCFVKGEGDRKEMAKHLVEQELNCSLPFDEIFYVRNVAPNKDMMRVSFQLTRSIVLDSKRKIDSCMDKQTYKKIK